MNGAGETQVVEKNAEVSETESTAVKDQTTEVEEKGTESSSAETQNTEEDVPFHKHPRWQQIMQRNKEMEEELKGYQPYKQFDGLLQQHPKLYERINKATLEYAKESMNGNDGTGIDDATTNAPDPNARIDKIERNLTCSKYDIAFETLAKDVPESERQYLQEQTERQMYLITKGQDPFTIGYNPNLLKKAFKAAKDQLDGIVAGRQVAYTKSKQDDDIPHAGEGTHPSKEPDFSDQGKRASFLAQGLKRGK